MASFVGYLKATEHFPCQTSLGRLLEECNLSAPGKGYSGDSENNKNQKITKNLTSQFLNKEIIQVNNAWEEIEN